VVERSAAERRKPETEDGGDVAVARAPDDPVAGRSRGFVEHHQHEPLDDLGGTGPAVRVRADQLVDGRIDAALLSTGVFVEALPRLPAEPPVLHHPGERRRRRKAIAEGLVHDARHLLRDVHPHFVEQRDRADREAELHHQVVDLVDGDALLQQAARLVHVRCEDAVDPEAGAVLHHDGGLAHPPPERDRRARDPGRGALPRDHLEQGHPGHR
jgi:hypothetical protein